MSKKFFAFCEVFIISSAVAVLAAIPFFWRKVKPAQEWTVTVQDSQQQPLGTIQIKAQDLGVVETAHGAQINVTNGKAVWKEAKK